MNIKMMVDQCIYMQIMVEKIENGVGFYRPLTGIDRVVESWRVGQSSNAT